LKCCIFQIHFLPYLQTTCTPCKNASSASLQLGLKPLYLNLNLEIALKSVPSLHHYRARPNHANEKWEGLGCVIIFICKFYNVSYCCNISVWKLIVSLTASCCQIKLVDNLLTVQSFRLHPTFTKDLEFKQDQRTV